MEVELAEIPVWEHLGLRQMVLSFLASLDPHCVDPEAELAGCNGRCYLLHPLGASRHEYECQAQARTVKREGDGKEGEGQWTSCERDD